MTACIIAKDPFYDSPITHTEEEMKAIVKERIRQMEAGEVKMIPGEQVFAEMCERYGFKIWILSRGTVGSDCVEKLYVVCIWNNFKNHERLSKIIGSR